MCNTIEKKYFFDELVSSLEWKTKKLEEEVCDMHEWDKLLLSINPTLMTNLDMLTAASQASFHDNPPHTHLTSHSPSTYATAQNRPSFIHMPPMNTHFPNHSYLPQHHAYASIPQHLTPRLQNLTMQAPWYEMPLHRVSCHHAPFIQFPVLP